MAQDADNTAAATDAATDEKQESQSLETFLKNNKLYNSELYSVLNGDGIENTEELKNHFNEADDIDAVIKSVRKRTEKLLGKFSKKVTTMTGIDYEYKPPRRRAKGGGNNNNINSNHRQDSSYLSAAESPRSRPRRKRTGSNSSIGSTGSNNSARASQGRSPRGQPAKTGKELRVATHSQSARMMKQWLQQRSIFHKDLFDYLASHGYYSPDDLIVLTEKEFDTIVREVRVTTFKEVNQAAKRNRVDKLLVKFEKEWRKYSGIRKTNMTKEQQELWGYSPVSSRRASEAEDEDDQGFFT